MTCIVAVKHDDQIYMGADMFVSGGDQVFSETESKLYGSDNGLIFGVSGSPLIADLLKYKVDWTGEIDDDLRGYLVTHVFPQIIELREAYKADPSFGVLIGYKGQLLDFDNSLAISTVDEYAATGSGRMVALGALAVNGAQTPRTRVLEALGAAAKWTTMVRGPFQIAEG
jgi:ATP-dependent protease HslVU (ClpYQ) peptidase subunit